MNKSSQFLAPKAMKKMYKACIKYPEWKQKHQPHFKPWLHPEQSPLPSLALSELSVQHADSLENTDESACRGREPRGAASRQCGGEGSDDLTPHSPEYSPSAKTETGLGLSPGALGLLHFLPSPTCLLGALGSYSGGCGPVSYTHRRAHDT